MDIALFSFKVRHTYAQDDTCAHIPLYILASTFFQSLRLRNEN